MERKLASKAKLKNSVKQGNKTRRARDSQTSERGFLLKLKISKYKNHTTYTLILKKPEFLFFKALSSLKNKKNKSLKKLKSHPTLEAGSGLGQLISTGLVLGGVVGLMTILIPLSPVKFSFQDLTTSTLAMTVAEPDSTQTSKLIYSMTASPPVSISIPSIGLSSPLINTTVNESGELIVPSRYDVAAWYDKSPTPGEIGPSVIVGHLNSFEGDAVFAKLSEITAGSLIAIKRSDGSTANFKAETVLEVPQDGFITNQVYGNVNYAGLRLITCGGTYNYLTGRYSNNIVVFAGLSKD